MSLPYCAARRGGHERCPELFCTHPKVHSKGHRVNASICRTCPYISPVPPDEFRALPASRRQLSRRPNLEIVVAKYREDVSWLKRFSGVRVTMYDKGATGEPNSLPNVGREAHTYLYHIIERYDSLAEMTVFIQGHPFDHIPSPDDVIWALDADTEYQDLCDHVLIEDRHGEPIQPGLPLGDFYERVFNNTSPDHFLSHAAACFAVSAEAIRQLSKDYYRHLMQAVLDESLGPWAIERLWETIFRTTSQTEGIVTAADAGYFQDLQFLIRSLEHFESRPVAVFDLGMHPEQREWLLERAGVSVLKPPTTFRPFSSVIGEKDWQLWFKPLLIYQSPFDRPLWIDADCVVLSPLDDAFGCMGESLLVCTDTTEAPVENSPGLYETLQIPADVKPTGIRLNSGVVGLCRVRDRQLLNSWAYGVQKACIEPRLKSQVLWGDQGILLWSVLHHRMTDMIQSNERWNQPATTLPTMLADSARAGHCLLDEFRKRYPAAAILHWLGIYKLSHQLTVQLEHLFSQE